MKILLHHLVRIPATHYGGTERVLLWLARGLQELGHEVGIVASADSGDVSGLKIYKGESDFFSSGEVDQYELTHFFTTPPKHWLEKVKKPVISTIQGNGKLGESFHENTVFVSKNHANRHGSDVYVYNGLDPDELGFDANPRPDRFLFLSRTDWRVKNVRGAIRMCAFANQNLWVAGGQGPRDGRFVVQAMNTLGKDWRWVGSVDQKQKAEFLVRGKAMLFPVLWNEPFGIVMTEALVSGTPFFGPNYGSVPEILEFAPQLIMKSKSDWKRALLGRIPMPSAKDCREWVISKFHYRGMTESYLRLYERVVSGKALNPKQPVTRVAATDIRDIP